MTELPVCAFAVTGCSWPGPQVHDYTRKQPFTRATPFSAQAGVAVVSRASDLCLLGDLQGVIDRDAQVADSDSNLE